MTTAEQNAELGKPVARTVYFVEFQFASATTRVSTANLPITWGGHEWSGVGTLGTIGTVDESDGLEAKSLSFTVNSAQPAWLALAMGPAQEYRGRPAKMYMCPLNDAFQMVGTPEQCWSGLMDSLDVAFGDESGTITLRCETSAYGLKRRPPFRLNAAQHKKEHPADTGLDYLNDLISNPSVWLSVRFQQK